MRALNIYSSNYHSHLLCRKKTCTIRLGDKTAKYGESDIVWVTAGNRYSPRKKVFTGILDAVQLKTVRELTPEDLRGESPDIRSHQDIINYLSEIYSRTVSEEDLVTVIYFSEIIE